MDEPEPDNDLPSPPPPGRPSLIPSWVMLGFVLGAVFVWAFQRKSVSSAAPPAITATKKIEAEPASSPIVLTPPRITAIEAVFEEWGRYAVWEDDLTEVALWNGEAKAFTDYFEVSRANGHFYFRSIPRLTRPLLTRGIKENSPLQFTETLADREEWMRQVREENVRAFTEAARETFNPSRNEAVAIPPPPPPRVGPSDGRP
jgi:hypothetical protein